MAHTKSQGSTTNGRDSAGQRLGVKAFGGQQVPAGAIIVRQRGTKFFPGKNAGMGSDYSIFARISGKVNFSYRTKNRCFVNIIPETKQS